MSLMFCKGCLKRRFLIGNLSKHYTRRESSKQYVKAKFNFIPEDQKIANLIEKYRGPLLYSGYIQQQRLGYLQHAAIIKTLDLKEKHKFEKESADPLPLSLKYLYPIDSIDNAIKEEGETNTEPLEENVVTHFPFKVKDLDTINCTSQDTKEVEEIQEYKNLADLEVKERLKHLNTNNWMVDYDNYEENELEEIDNWTVNYGTPDPNSNISNVSCGGCGALLHCKDTAIPGYIPSEIYKNHSRKGGIALQGIICQRCYFLKNYNLALQIQVSPEEYPKVLRTVRDRKQALVVLIADLLDLPCSIWPGAADLLGPGRPIVLVGNKVDLLPQDGDGFIERVTKHLRNSARESGFGTTDIKHVALISATTGFGVEDLITRLHNFWRMQGDVFLIGCTNVGKSSLFNALLQSDYCKSQAADLIQRATVSLWPGTTLNLLKFPILRMSGHRAYLRSERLKKVNRRIAEENALKKAQLQTTKHPKLATLIGHIGRTFSNVGHVPEDEDIFAVKPHRNTLGKVNIGIDGDDKTYTLSKWCYDTPGVVQPEQLLHLLTTQELLLTLPKHLLQPKIFCLHRGTTIFIGGLARLDFVEGASFARFVVFCSSALPITICNTDVADELYKDCLGTEMFAAPIGDAKRLQFWPGLKRSKEFTVKGIDQDYCCADVVLSSCGWISVAGANQVEYKLKAWMPENCGIYLRDALLPGIVTLRGKRIRSTPAYKKNRAITM